MARFWTCSRVTAGVRCRAKNSGRLRKCVACGKPRPARKRPAHMKALEFSHAHYVKVNGGNRCGICLVGPEGRTLNRDHVHVGDGIPRGILCWRCNKFLQPWMDETWLLAALKYVQRTPRLEVQP